MSRFTIKIEIKTILFQPLDEFLWKPGMRCDAPSLSEFTQDGLKTNHEKS